MDPVAHRRPGLGQAAGGPARERSRAERAAHQRQRGDPGDQRERDRPAARQHAGPEPQADRGHGQRVEAVEEYEEAEHARGGGAARHARAPQRPDLQGDPARAGGAQEPRGRMAGERDVVARAVPDPRRAIDEHGPEEDDVAEEGQRLEPECEHQPVPVGVPQLGER